MTAYITLALIIVLYLLNHSVICTENPVDKLFLDKICFRVKAKSAAKWTAAIEETILVLSDTQILSGIAVLLCGYIQLPQGLALYHWQVVVDLAWFSSITHLATLTALREYFRSRPQIAMWRLLFMLVNVVLLVVAMVPTAYDQSSSLMAEPAICLFTAAFARSSGDGAEWSLTGFSATTFTITILYLSASHCARTVRLFARSELVAHEWLRRKPSRFSKYFHNAILEREERTLRISPDTCTIIVRAAIPIAAEILRASYLVFKITFDFASCMVSEVSSSHEYQHIVYWSILTLLFIRFYC